jgi:hypothetical protein
MTESIDQSLLKDILINGYIKDFEKKTGENLLEEIILHKTRLYKKLSCETLRSIVDQFIPDKLIMKGITTIAIHQRFMELSDLKMIYSKICQDHGHKNDKIAASINLDRSTISHRGKKLREIIHKPRTYHDLMDLYNKVQLKIIEHYEKSNQPVQCEQDHTEPGLSLVLDTGWSESLSD